MFLYSLVNSESENSHHFFACRIFPLVRGQFYLFWDVYFSFESSSSVILPISSEVPNGPFSESGPCFCGCSGRAGAALKPGVRRGGRGGSQLVLCSQKTQQDSAVHSCPDRGLAEAG